MIRLHREAHERVETYTRTNKDMENRLQEILQELEIKRQERRELSEKYTGIFASMERKILDIE